RESLPDVLERNKGCHGLSQTTGCCSGQTPGRQIQAFSGGLLPIITVHEVGPVPGINQAAVNVRAGAVHTRFFPDRLAASSALSAASMSWCGDCASPGKVATPQLKV